MPRRSAGLLVYKRTGGRLSVFLVHPGGPFWKAKDDGAWSIPKGEFTEGDDPFAAALREFTEETSQTIAGNFQALPPCRQAGGKIVQAWAIEGEVDADAVKSNLFVLEWPRGSGRMERFPEVDRGAWFEIDEARQRILRSQLPLLEALERLLEANDGGHTPHPAHNPFDRSAIEPSRDRPQRGRSGRALKGGGKRTSSRH